MGLKVIITGTTGMVGEGVLFECLENPAVDRVLSVTRKKYDMEHPKLQQCLIPDFFNLQAFTDQLSGYDACFFCAGISSIGMNEMDYTRITYDLTLNLATLLAKLNPGMTFIYVSGASTDSTAKGRTMWARVKGKTENDLLRLPFRQVYNFRPAFMKDTKGQKNVKSIFKIILVLYPIVKLIIPNSVSTLTQVGKAMINASLNGYEKKVLEVADINTLSGIKS